MPTEGYTTMNVKTETYWKIKELSARQRMKMSDFMEKLVNDFEVAEI